MEGMEQIKGVIEKISYVNEENGYTVCQISCESTDYDGELITLVGILPMVNVGELIVADGEWGFHRQFGRQFNVKYFEKELPTSSVAILRYLSARTVKGVGPKTAAKIVGKFGDSTFEVMEKDPDRLAQINGITLQKAREICKSFNDQKEIRAVMLFCRDHLGPSLAVKIHKRWGGAAVDIMKQNPYVLCDEINGIGFEKADRVAKSLGLEGNSPQRVRSAVIHVLTYNAENNGHTLVPKNRLVELTKLLLKDVESEDCENAIDVLADKKRIVIKKVGGHSCVYLASYYRAENYIRDKLDMLEATCEKKQANEAEALIVKTERELGIAFDKMQKRAIMNCLGGGVLVLTGGPGTGKTTVIKGMISLFKSMKMKYILAAPTGRAAKRMTEATGEEAKTIHRMLEMIRTEENESRFMRDADNPLEEKVVIVDEASMIDTLLMEALLRAISPGSRLIIIGDANQLPSVGAGNVLSEILESERYRTVKLTKIFRQAGQSLIVTNAHAINAGEDPEIYSKNSDFFFVERNDEASIADTVANLCVNRLPKTYGSELLGQIQVITPSHNGAAGTNALNILLQGAINPPSPRKKEKKHRDVIFRQGDRVMQIKNDYDILWQKNGEEGSGIFNGDIGEILSILQDEECMLIDFEGRLTRYDFSMLDELEHAYAITVHKSQGSGATRSLVKS